MNLDKLRTLSSNKSYIQVKFQDHLEIFSNRLELSDVVYEIPPSVVEELCKLVGMPRSLNILRDRDLDAWMKGVLSLYDYYYGEDISFLVEGITITHVSTSRITPLLNVDFLDTSASILSEYSDILTVSDYRYQEDSYTSTISIFKNGEIIKNDVKYRLGVMLSNDELDTVTCRYLVESNGFRFLLPSKYMNLSASRYLRNSVDRKEALSQMLLKLIENISSDSWTDIINDIDSKINECSTVKVTYEEYNKLVKLLKYVSVQSEIDDSLMKDMLEELSDIFSDFSKNYISLEDKSSSYIWRCSAVSENNILSLLNYVFDNWLETGFLYPESVEYLEEYLGSFIMSEKISNTLARRKREIRNE